MIHPDLPGFGAVGMFPAQGPFFPLLELQARWLVALWAGDVAPPPDGARCARRSPAPSRRSRSTTLFATALADELGVAPDLLARPDLTEPLLFGPLLPPRYRFDGPGAQPDAVASSAPSSPRRPARRSTRPTSRRCAASGLARAPPSCIRAAAAEARWHRAARGERLGGVSDQHGFLAPAEAYDRHIGRYGPELAKQLIARRGRASPATACSTSAAAPAR